MPAGPTARRKGRPGPAEREPTAGDRRPTVLVEYTGRTSLVLRGPVTGRTYRFRGEGMVLAVDRRDAAHLERVPALRPIGPPAAVP